MLSDGCGIKGEVILTLFDGDMHLKSRQTINNLVVNTGLYHVADQLSDQSQAQMSRVAIGTDNTIVSESDVSLGSEIARVVVDSITQGVGTDANKVTYVATFNPGIGTGAIVESGIFNATTAGVMLTRSIFGVINKGALDTLVVTWELIIGFI